MSVVKLLRNLQDVRSRVRVDATTVLTIGSRASSFSDKLTLQQIANDHARGRTFFGYKITESAMEDVIDLSLSEIENLQLKVKALEQKLQAIDDVLKGGSV